MELASESRSVIVGGDARHGVVKWSGLVGWLVICFAAAAAGAPFAPDDWYAQLNRPAFAPPDYLFGPVWTVLYLCMAVAAWLVWKSDRLTNTWRPLALFLSHRIREPAWLARPRLPRTLRSLSLRIRPTSHIHLAGSTRRSGRIRRKECRVRIPFRTNGQPWPTFANAFRTSRSRHHGRHAV